MKIDIDSLLTKPSFNFLVYQGVINLISIATALLILPLVLLEQITEDFMGGLIMLIFGFCFPILVLFSLIRFYLKRHNLETLYSWRVLLLLFIVLLASYLFIICTGYKDESLYSLPLIGYFAMLFLAPIVVVVFLLIPYVVTLYVEKKHNWVISRPPFFQNRFSCGVILFAILMLILTCLLPIYLWIDMQSAISPDWR